MPETKTNIPTLCGHPLTNGNTWDLGELNVSAGEIIAFAHVVDPLPFHIDPEAARKSQFGTLVASGPMMYSEFHKRALIPLFGASILAGAGISDWHFIQPHYPDTSYFGTLTALDVQLRPDKGIAKVHWHFVFRDAKGELAQELKVRILHQLDPA